MWKSLSNYIVTKKNYVFIFLLSLNFMAIAYFIYFLKKYGFLPAPFVSDHFNTFMDLFYPMQHALLGDGYDIYQSVYAPLIFVFLKFLHFVTSAPKVLYDPFLLRNASLDMAYVYLAFSTALTFLSATLPLWKKIPRIDKVFIFLIFVTSNIYLFTIERANIILLAPFFITACLSMEGKKAEIIKAFLISLLINIKSYFSLFLLTLLKKMKWKVLTLSAILSGVLFLIFGFLYNSNFYLFFKNNFIFLNYPNLLNPKEVLSLPSSLSGLIYVLEKNYKAHWVSQSFLDFMNLNYAIIALKIFFYSVLTFSIFSILKNRKAISDNQCLALVILLIINMNFNFGGYTMIFYISIFPILHGMKNKIVYLFLLSLIFAPIDITFYRILHHISHNANLFSPSFGDDQYQVTLGVFRPLLNLMLLFFYSLEILRQKKNEISTKG